MDMKRKKLKIFQSSWNEFFHLLLFFSAFSYFLYLFLFSTQFQPILLLLLLLLAGFGLLVGEDMEPGKIKQRVEAASLNLAQTNFKIDSNYLLISLYLFS